MAERTGERDGTEPAVVMEERAEDLLEHSSSSIETELDHAQSWLRTVTGPTRIVEWSVDAEAGAIGCLANAWGRLTLWARANGTYDQVQGDLDESMECLVELRQHILHGALGPDDMESLRQTLECLREIHQIAHQKAG